MDIKKTVNPAEIRLQIAAFWLDLLRSKKTENRKSFNETMLGIIPEMKKYIAHRVKVLLKKEAITKGKLELDDFIDELFIEAYDSFSHFDKAFDFSNWLYQKVDELLEDASIEDQFNAFFFENIDDYTQVEWDSMEEKFTIDGGGDFVMEEELSEQLKETYAYTLKDVFIEDKDKELITKIDAELNAERINNHINMVLYNLPLTERNLFDLTVTQKLEVSEISKIKNTAINEINNVMNDLREKLKSSFIQRFNYLA